MSTIVKAVKEERITSVTLKQYNGTATFQGADKGSSVVSVEVPDPVVEVLDDLIALTSDEACPEPTLESLRARIVELREQRNVTWGDDKGQPSPFEVTFTIAADEAVVVRAVMSGGDILYGTRQAVRAALNDNADW